MGIESVNSFANILKSNYEQFVVCETLENKPILEFVPTSDEKGNITFNFDEEMRKLVRDAAERLGNVTLSGALAELAKREQYLALEKTDWRYDVGVKYGLLSAQLALALSGQDRDEVLAKLLELLALREMGRE